VLEWVDEGGSIVVRRAGGYTTLDLHRAAFGGKKPEAKTLEEMKQGIRDYVRRRYARD
jgi:hypothetical protein